MSLFHENFSRKFKLINIKAWLYQKCVAPLIDQLKQGVSPNTLASSLAVGILIGIFPLIGISTGISFIVAYIFRLNHIAIQIANYAVYPLQFLLAVPFYRLGEWLFQIDPIPLNLLLIVEHFTNHFIEALQKYGATGLRAVVVWGLIFTPVYFLIYYAILKLLKYFDKIFYITKK